MNRSPNYFGTERTLTRSNVPGLILSTSLFWILARALRRFRNKHLFRDAVVLITGGSRGLGLEVARLFAKEGSRLVLLARNERELENARRELAAKGAEVRIIRCDLADKTQLEDAVNETLQAFGRVDVLVNNAGIIQFGPQENMNLHDYEQAMNIHAWAPLHLIRTLIPVMKRQRGGRIVNVTSIGGLVGFPHMLPYAMSKFAAVGLSDGMRAELAKDGIIVTTIAPGLMRTGSHIHAQMKGQHEKEFAWFALSNAVPLLSMDSTRAARKIVNACRAGRARVILNWQARLLYAMNALFPEVVATGMKLAVLLLPSPGEKAAGADREVPGYRSRSRRAPKLITFLSDRASRRNNETEAA